MDNSVSHKADSNHAGLMDDIYRYQRTIYDATRKYYLLGRDRLIAEMAPQEDAHILEIACGTGRNLDLLDRRYPDRTLCGLDISEQMLETARTKLAGRANLAQADACNFDSESLFGRKDFDHIVMSYSLSMIPDWQGAISEALKHLAPGGKLHLVDFGDQAQLPALFKHTLRNWLDRFHVSPRDELNNVLLELASEQSLKVSHRYLYRHYAQLAQVEML
ncbi:class I SAM-dependent methyltransferase [uncultured Cohaesibacter sp.]|uniref:class I SAM-dependent methyltransferase n=1 Tax=uncultured Cohaesibacter sp. TaxID=1002546 RepID=UPI002AA793CC|nr:class I SAM-dependent methyltransferase [uncultured Cohaesibacter sp.]